MRSIDVLATWLICEGWAGDEQLPFGALTFSSLGDHAEKFEVNNFRGISVSGDWKFHVSIDGDKTPAQESAVAVAAAQECGFELIQPPHPYPPDVTPYNYSLYLRLLQMPYKIQCIHFTGHYSHMRCILCIVYDVSFIVTVTNWVFAVFCCSQQQLQKSLNVSDTFSSSMNNLNILRRETGKENVLNQL